MYILMGYLNFNGPSVFWWANVILLGCFYLFDMSLFC